MKKEDIIDYISITCIATCPICDQDFDAEETHDAFLVMQHIESEHTYKQVREFLEDVNR